MRKVEFDQTLSSYPLMDVIRNMSGQRLLKGTQNLGSCLLADGQLVMCEKSHGEGAQFVKEA
jgi:hypothetical protein